MKYEKLLDENKIEKFINKQEVNFDISLKDLDTAKENIKLNVNWAFVIAYEAVLRAGNKLMNFLGYRAIGKEHHKNMFEFLKETEINQELIKYFDNIRKKRNDFVYRDIEAIQETEAKEIIEKAGELVQEIRTFVLKNRTEEDEDSKLTPEEEILVEEARKEFKEGKRTSLEELKKELN
ncbi:MAG: HEPN domain-containing protein [Candidatus Nanoarchaeia archaeon]